MLTAATVLSTIEMGAQALQTGSALIKAAGDFYTATKTNFSAEDQATIEAQLSAAATTSDAAGAKADTDLSRAAAFQPE